MKFTTANNNLEDNSNWTQNTRKISNDILKNHALRLISRDKTRLNQQEKLVPAKSKKSPIRKIKLPSAIIWNIIHLFKIFRHF